MECIGKYLSEKIKEIIKKKLKKKRREIYYHSTLYN